MDLNYIEDKQINLEKGDLLRTKPYVNTIIEIIQKAVTPFTVGLFGGWGTGKSSIIKTIEDKYNASDSRNIKVFVYDAWKYSQDTFRRTFILKLKKEFRLEEDVDYQNFYNDKHEDVAHKNQIDKKKAFFGLLYLLPLLLFIVWFIPKANLDLQIALSVISIISTIIFYFLKDVYVQYKISITKPKTFAPEQFEDAFIDAVQKITSPTIMEKCKKWFRVGEKTIFADKIVIVIDNIDRCHKELAFELLLTVKTFLEQKDKKIIFILPIDENEIKKHIEKEGHDGNEFLRKLFNTTLTIKKFSEDDLFDFTEKLQKRYKLNLSNDVLSLISQEFSKNPRKIIQFLNVLQTEIKLAEEQEKNDFEGKSNFEKGVITKNIEFLVKILLIREEWGDLYEKLNENPFLLEEINKLIDENGEKIIYAKNKKDESIFLTEQQKRFFESTRDISTDNIESFFANKDSSHGMPDDTRKLVLSQDWKTLKTKYLIKDTFNLNDLLYFIDNLYKKEIDKRKLLARSGLNIFSLIFKIAKDKNYGEKLLKTFYSSGKILNRIKSKLNNKEINSMILNFKPSLLVNFVKTNLNKNNRLFQEIIITLNEQDYENDKRYDLLQEYINEFKEDAINLKKISKRFSDLLKEDPDIYEDFKDILKNTVATESLIEPGLLEEFISTLKPDHNSEDVADKINIINNYQSTKGLSSDLLDKFVEKIIESLDSMNDLNIMLFWFKQLNPLIENVQNKTLRENIFNTLNQKNTFLWQEYDSQWSIEDYQKALQAFLDVANAFYNSGKASKSEIATWLNNFFSKNESPQIAIGINRLYIKTIKYFTVFNWLFTQNVIDKFSQLPEWEDKKEIAITLNQMLTKTTEEKGLNESQIKSIIQLYINNLSNDEENVKNWLKKVIKNSHVNAQLEEVIKGLSSNEKLNIIEVIKEISKELLKECIEKIIIETNSNDLEITIEKLDSANVGQTLVKIGIEKKIAMLQKEDDEEEFKKYLQIITDKKLFNQKILIVIVNKIRPLLDNEKSKDEKVFALQILDKITIPKNQKVLMTELIKILDTNEFNDEEKELYKKIKDKK